jgi:hypothetical protein
MTLHREWFCEYEKHNRGDFFLGDDSVTRITRHGRVIFLLNDGRIIILLRVFHIPKMVRNLISIIMTSDEGVHIVFEKETWKMV